MVQKSLKILFSFVMMFSLLAPMMVSYYVDGSNSVYMLDINEEEHSHDSQKKLAKEKGEKDWIVQDISGIYLVHAQESLLHTGYLLMQSLAEPDILLPPPEHIA